MIIKQFQMGSMDNFCYLVGCEQTRKAVVIDPGINPERVLSEAHKHGLDINYIVNTHGHADHTAGSAQLKRLSGAQIIIHALDAAAVPEADIRWSDESDLKVGEITFRVLHTPGHTPGGICLYAQENLFTGDTLFVGDSGRTDLPGGHRPTLAASIRRLMQLPDSTVIWPGHDYGPTPSSTIAWEKRHNINAREYGYFVQDDV
ncbi:MAG: MBL fold metallo-hydrolase [Desulfobacterales bacterium]|jgi:glyoxylase-like metal-dependent hydrolase (beta-lactamase superfamily II)|nr:MBL fold metallo-hydrolase [Desulfobacterales bacterium]